MSMRLGCQPASQPVSLLVCFLVVGGICLLLLDAKGLGVSNGEVGADVRGWCQHESLSLNIWPGCCICLLPLLATPGA